MRGFTVIELVFILVVMALLAVFSLGSFDSLIQKNEQETIRDDIKTIIQYARLKALELGGAVSLMPLDSKSDWSLGIMLTHWDKKTNSITRIHQWPWQHPHWQVSFSGMNSNSRIVLTDKPLHAMSNGQFIIKNKDTGEQEIILLNRLGRVRS
jgi:Tfp pilus assembly protein FimT